MKIYVNKKGLIFIFNLLALIISFTLIIRYNGNLYTGFYEYINKIKVHSRNKMYKKFTEVNKLTYSPAVPKNIPNEKIVYLTFDDGPSSHGTPKILDILKKYDIKATFFVVGKYVEANPDVLRRIHSEGHKIANHSYSHSYNNCTNVEKLTKEIYKTEEVIKKILGIDHKNTVFRFPGGSNGKNKILKNAVEKNGFQYIDWNCLGNDSISKKLLSKEEIINSVKKTSQDLENVTILLHDSNSKTTTFEAVPEIIEYFLERKFKFLTIPDKIE
ncbi:MAG: polysaccharide deacetylase [Clostridiales bacterium]|nr:polysaccharide deacetylase [Clostridiales bacterium]